MNKNGLPFWETLHYSFRINMEISNNLYPIVMTTERERREIKFTIVILN